MRESLLRSIRRTRLGMMTQIGRSSIVSTTTQLSPGGNSSYSLILALRCLVPCRSVCCHIRLGREMCVLTRQIYLAAKCWNKFSMGGIFHWTYLSFSLFFSLFSPFLYPFLFFSLFLFPSLWLSLAVFLISSGSTLFQTIFTLGTGHYLSSGGRRWRILFVSR